jgi:4-cresol dehydrogenase (hydroxylating)
VSEFLNLAQGLFHEQGFDLYVALLVMNPRSIVTLMAILYRKEDTAEIHRASILYERLCALALSQGYQQYRAAMPAWRELFDQAPGFLKLCDTLKSAVDPNNIMAPGHYGIGLSHVLPDRDTQ